MPGPDTVAEEAPVLTGFGLALLSLLMWIALRGVRGFWQLTFGALFLSLAGVRIGKSFFGGTHPFGFLKDLNDRMMNTLEDLAAGYENAMGYWFHQSARLQIWIADETWKVARDTFGFGEWVVRTYGPTLVKVAGTITFPWAKLYRVIDSEIEKLLPKVGRIAHDATGATEAELAKLGRGIDRRLVKQAGLIAALGVEVGALAGGLVWPHPGGTFTLPKAWRGLTKRLLRIERRLSRLEVGVFGATAMAIAMANVLGVSARCLRKGNVGRTARALCGLPTNLLNDLLGILADIWVVENVCVLLPFLETAVSKVGTPLVEALTVAGAGICKGHKAPPPLQGPKANVPALIFGVSASEV